MAVLDSHNDRSQASSGAGNSGSERVAPSRSFTAEAIQTWLIAELCERLYLAPEEVDIRESFTSYGLSSREAVVLSGDLETWLGRQLPPTLLWDYPHIEALSKHLAEQPCLQPETSAAAATHDDEEDDQRSSPQKSVREPIAITGIGCRFPGANGAKEFWNLLRAGVNAITEVPAERWNLSEFYDADSATPGKINTRWGGFIKQADMFDARYFGISPREASRMDPQQRVLLEVTLEALEDAGQATEQLAGSRTGVFIGISNNDYGRMLLSDPDTVDAHIATGNGFCIAANRLSYLFDLRGPSLALDTACSSSLVAVHLACQSLWNGESTLALAGGVNLILSPEITINFTKAGAMSPDGSCKAFDASANGYVRSEGAGVVVLKTLSSALADGDPVYALIRGSAVSQDGRTNGLMAPNQHSQEAVLREAYEHAGVSACDIQYVEAHGTGTLLGDPIEVKALGAVLAEGRAGGDSCVLGSVKTNIGHLEPAAGIAGLIKLALSLKHREIPPSLHFQQPNPYIPFDELPLSVQRTLTPWPLRPNVPALGGVSSFGFGGTNSHVVLEEAPHAVATVAAARQSGEVERTRTQLLPLSARTQKSLRGLASDYRSFLTGTDADVVESLEDICYSASVRRNHHEHRLALLANSREELTAQLEEFLSKDVNVAALKERRTATNRRAKLAFVFSGQGAQWCGMGRELLEQEPVFRASLEHCDELFSRYSEWSLVEELCADESRTRLAETEIAQPLIFALQVSLAALWRHWGIVPDAVVGHSSGEVAAAYVAGALSLEDALRVIYHRGRVMQQSAGLGRMAAVELSQEEAEQAIAGYGVQLCVAAINSPSATVIAGETEALTNLIESLQERQIFCRLLPVNYAFHSAQMEPLQSELARSLEPLPRSQAPTLSILSTLTGRSASEGDFNVEHWCQQMRQPVRFAAAIDELVQDGYQQFIEIGPHPVLSGAVKQCLSRRGQTQGVVLPSLRRGTGEQSVLLKTLGQLYTHGHTILWSNLHTATDTAAHRYVQLPTYHFERERYWMESARQQVNGKSVSAEHAAAFTSNVSRSTLQLEEEKSMNREVHVSMSEADINVARRTSPARREQLLSQVSGIICRQLEMDTAALDPYIPFLEIGADSIVLLEAIRTIEETFDVKLSIRQLFEEYNTLDALVSYLETNLPVEQNLNVAPPLNNAAQVTTTTTPPTTAAPASLTPTINALETMPQQRAATSVAASHASESSLERLMSQQLSVLSQFMSEQLEVLRGHGSTQALSVSPQASHGVSVNQPQSAVAPHTITQPAVVAANAIEQTPSSDIVEDETGKAAAAWTPHKSFNPGSVEELNERQRAYLNNFVERYTARTAESKRQTQIYRQAHADLKPSMNFRLCTKEMRYPIIGARSQGSRLWDVDGNEYVDFTMGYGLNLFGHNAPFITEAIREQLELGMHMGPQTQLAGEVAELMCELTNLDRVAFCNTGTEAVMAALRLARTATGRMKVAIFAGSYHGTWDGVLVDPQSADGKQATMPVVPGVPPEMVKDMLVLNYGSAKSLEVLKAHLHELAAVLVEPVQSRKPELQPREFLHEVRRLTEDAGVALIFDEVITGFRILPGGAQEWYGIQADLATYGKIIGGGMPIGAVAGKSRFMNPIDGGMWSYGDASVPTATTTLYSGTFCKHPLAMAAARVVLKRIKEHGADIYPSINQRTAQLAATLNEYLELDEVPLRLSQFGSLFRIGGSFQLSSPDGMDVLFYNLIHRGIYVWEGRNWFLSTEHTDEDIAQLVRAVKESVAEVREGRFMLPARRRESSLEATTRRELSTGVHAAPESVQTLPLTEAQRQLWFLEQLGDHASIAYNESVILKLRGALNLPAMQRAWQEVSDRHEALRTTFSREGDVQRVAPKLKIDVPVLDFSALDGSTRQTEAERCLEEENRARFDLTDGPLLRVKLIKLSDVEHLLSVTAHHIIVDGWSFGVVLKEVADIYSSECEGAECSLSAPLQFSEYVKWQAEQSGNAQMAASESYWKEQLALPLPDLNLPADHQRPPVKTYRGGRQSISLSPAVYQQLKKFSGKNKCTLYTTLLSAYLVLLHRLTRQDDIIVGSPVQGRSSLKGSEHLVGYCANLMAVRSRIKDDPKFDEYLTRIKHTLLESYDHQDYSFATLINALDIPRDPSISPVVATTFNLDRPAAPPQMTGLQIELASPQVFASKFDLSLNVTEMSGVLLVELDYSKDLFEASTVERMLNYFAQVLESILSDAGQRVSELRVFGVSEEQQQVVEWNATASVYERHVTIHEMFERQAAATPHAIAVSAHGEQLSYEQLNEQANQLAHYLRAQGVGAETRVGILLERSPKLIVTLLAILKAGGAYVPLDPAYPQERLRFMLKDAEVALLVTQESLRQLIPAESRCAVVTLDDAALGQQSRRNLTHDVNALNLAYVIYTSGSTGTPKGVAVPHRGVLRLVLNVGYVSLSSSTTILQLAPLAFDASTFEVWGALLCGGRCVLSGQRMLTATELEEVIRTEGVETLWLTSSLYNAIADERVEALGGVRQLLIGGEALSVKHVRMGVEKLKETQLINGYGPTESTTFACSYRIEATREQEWETGVPIGKPIANTEVYVLDERMRVVPVGVAGELYISGDGLARGYLNEPAQTAARFIPNPFSPMRGARMYRTGDVVRYLSNGEIEFIGRVDHQVKVRGFRIELGEIESALTEHSAIKECIVIVREDVEGDKRLVAYLSEHEGESVASSELRAYLKERMPEYMIPSAFVMLERLPLTANGKVDRQALPAPEQRSGDGESSYVAARTPVEELLAGLWSEVLRVERVGVEDNFFELGGHSLLATQLVSRIRETFGVELPLRMLFEQPTLDQLARSISMMRGTSPQTQTLVRASCEQRLPLSFAQQRLWFLDQFEPGSVALNVPGAVRLSGALDVAALERALSEIVRRHEVLRTTFRSVDGEPMQVIGAAVEVRLPLIDLQGRDESEREAEAQQLAQAEAARAFDLSTGPLLRTTLLRLAEEEHVLLVTLHHIVGDGWSIGVLFRELSALYRSYSLGEIPALAELPIQYADYAAWQCEWLQGEVLEAQLDYWRTQLSGVTSVSAPLLQTDRTRPAAPSFRGASRSFVLPVELTDKLKQLSRTEGVTLFMTLLAAFKVLLHRHSKQEQIVVGTDIANRNRAEVEDLIGFFVNILVLRTDLAGDPAFRQLLARVREVTLGAYAHQDMPFDRLVSELEPERIPGRAPFFEVLFVMQNTPASELDLPGLKASVEELGDETAKFDLAVFVEETAAGLAWKWNYDAELFEATTIERLAGHLETLLDSIAGDPDAKLSALEMYTEAERMQQAHEARKLKEKSFTKFKSIKPKAIDVGTRDVIRTSYLQPGERLPLVVRPALEGVDLADWALNNRDFIQENLRLHGAFLFRDFNINSIQEFERCAAAMSPELFTKYGDLPREEVSDKVYGSTPYPSDQPILFHNESSHLHCWPMKIFFHCVKAAEEGGETPLVDCRKVYQLLSPELRTRFEEKGIMYARTYTTGLDVSWEEFFRTTNRAEVEQQCLAAGIEWEWLEDNELRTRKTRTAISRHPHTGEAVFFNQMQLHHASCLDPAVRASLLDLFGEAKFPRNVYYGDGSVIEDDVIAEVSEAYARATVSFPWQEGDLILLDNMLTAHGRSPFVGERKIVVAMGEMYTSDIELNLLAGVA